VGRIRVPARLTALVVALGLVVGCRAAVSTTPRAQPLQVKAQPFALADVARRVGLGRVVVSDQGTVVLDPGSDTNPWLDPVAMEAVANHVADLLSAADPGGRAAYRSAARAYVAQLGALDIEYRSSLADCGRHDIVTADDAFASLAADYGFTDLPVSDPGIAAIVRAQGIPAIFTETGVPTGPAVALAQATHTKVGLLDTMTTALTAAQAAAGATYVSLMTDNLAALSAALACQAPT
jgi:ABC-type Zn uptake system ZnuABC Zn-binding protein ZnuA